MVRYGKIKKMKISLSYKNSLLLLIGILLLASFFRLYQLDILPPGLYPDEAMNANDALDTLESGDYKVFYSENNGREGLFVWLIAFSFKIFGPAPWSLRLVSAIFGILTVLGLYLLSSQLFNRKIALLSSFLLAVSFWHVNFSRIGFRAVLVPFLLCFSFYFLFRAFEKKIVWDYIWAGIFFGLGFYTYIAFRVAVLILGVVVLWQIIDYWLKKKRFQNKILEMFKKIYIKDHWWKIDVFFIAIIVILLPITFYFIQNPQDFIGRAGGVSVFGQEEPLKELALSVVKTLGSFNFYGDGNWRHNLAGSPLLAWPTGALFIIGLVLIIKDIFSKIWKKKIPDLVPLFLIVWFGSMLLPAVLTAEGLPHALRMIGVIPTAYIFAAIGFVWLYQKFSKYNKKLALIVLTLFLVAPTAINFHKYYFAWAKSPHTPGAFREDLVNLANHLNNLPEETKKYLIVNEGGVPVPHPDGLAMPAQTIIFIERTSNSDNAIIYLKPGEIEQITASGQPTNIILLKEDENILAQLLEKIPNGRIEKVNGFRQIIF